MLSKPVSESRSRGRTRKAILDAAFSVLSQRPAASLGEVAEEAGIGRSTLHRYFPERCELIAAMAEHAARTLAEAIAEAAVDQGTPVQALRRVVHAYFEFSPMLMFLVGEAQVRQQVIAAVDAADRPVLELIERGQREGQFAQDIPPAWVSRVLGWIVHAGAESVREGELTRFSAVETVIRTLESGVLAGPV